MSSGAHGEAGTRSCRFCASELPPSARLCTTCNRFQAPQDRLFSAINVGALTALLPIATLSYAYLNQAVIRPYSALSANVSYCSKEEVVLALANTGTRAAIVDGGAATFASEAKPEYDRGLKPPGEAFTPVVIKPSETLVSRFQFVDPHSLAGLPAPELPSALQCRYGVALAVLEFGGRRASVDAGHCTC